MEIRVNSQSVGNSFLNQLLGVDASEYDRLLCAYLILESALEAVIECEDIVNKIGTQATIRAIVDCSKEALAAAHLHQPASPEPDDEAFDCRKCGRSFDPTDADGPWCERCLLEMK